MGKKKPEEMAKQKATFVDGAKKPSVDAKIADQVFELMEFFAGYGFNKSHSAAYGWITYQTAYLKQHYPVEFMAGLMSCDADNIDKVVKFIAEARVDGPHRRAPRRQRVASGLHGHAERDGGAAAARSSASGSAR